MRVADFVSNTVELATPGKVPVYRIKEVADYDFAARGVTAQFLGDHETYYERYTNPSHFQNLYRIAFERGGVPIKAAARVLDIGTGGGNSVFAIRSILPDAQILGVDISQPLLELCAKAATDHYGIDGGMAMLVADLYDLKPVPESVDFITGSSILHHMLDPEALLLRTMQGLAPGGVAIFNEPMEEAHAIFRAILAGILEDDADHQDKLPETTKNFLSLYIRDFDARKGIGHVRPFTSRLDDKWFFTRTWFADVAQKTGCVKLSINQTHGGRDMFWRQFVVTSRLFADSVNPESLPPWVKRRFSIFDESLSDRQKLDITFAAVIVMQK